MLIAISTYTKPLAEVDQYRAQHLDYIKSTLVATDKLLLAGRKNPADGAVILAKDITADEFKKILTDDPYCKAGVAEYQILEFHPALFAETLRDLVT
jgi:uncharacterized protein YciI